MTFLFRKGNETAQLTPPLVKTIMTFSKSLADSFLLEYEQFCDRIDDKQLLSHEAKSNLFRAFLEWKKQ